MKILFFISLMLTSFTPTKNQSSTTKISCHLKSDKTTYKLGELPKFTVELVNNGKEDIYLIGSLDGSDVQWRFPHCYYTIEKPKPERNLFARCGNMNPIRVDDFRLLKAGARFNPEQDFFGDYAVLNRETFKDPGTYKLKFHYSTNSENISDFRGDRPFQRDLADSVKIDNLFKRVPKIELTSNEIEIVIEK